MTDKAFAFGLGVGTRNSKGDWLEVFFPRPILAPDRHPWWRRSRGCDSAAALDKSGLQAPAVSPGRGRGYRGGGAGGAD